VNFLITFFVHILSKFGFETTQHFFFLSVGNELRVFKQTDQTNHDWHCKKYMALKVGPSDDIIFRFQIFKDYIGTGSAFFFAILCVFWWLAFI